jgi:hypothetical protein
MHSETTLSTYDPDWEARWERCHAALTASRAEQAKEPHEGFLQKHTPVRTKRRHTPGL